MTLKEPNDLLDGRIALTDSLALSVRREIMNKIFRLNLIVQEFQARDNGLQTYFSDWFEDQCQAAASQVSVRTHRGLLEILTPIKSLLERSASGAEADI